MIERAMRDLFSGAWEAKEEGMLHVEANAAFGWRETMLATVEAVARTKQHFTSDDVFEAAGAIVAFATHDLRAFGPVMTRAAKQGLCRKANVAPVNSKRRSLHASPRAVWTSLIYNGGARR